MNHGQPPGSSSRWANTASMPRRNDAPRRVRNGLKLQSKLPLEPRGPVGAKWLRLMESMLPQPEVAAGLEYARLGQIVSLDVAVGAVTAHVQGMAYRPHKVLLEFSVLPPDKWAMFIDLMAREAIHVANLLAGEMPPAIDRLFADVGAPLFENAGAVAIRCDCTLGGQCRHAAAVGYLLTEQLDSRPLQLFTLLGQSSEQVLDRLRHVRTQQGDAHLQNHLSAQIPQAGAEVPPLEACMEEFWHAAPTVGNLRSGEQQAPLAHAPHALLRRLGPSPLQGKFPMVGLLASIYDSVSQSARQVRDEPSAGQSGENGTN